MSVKNKKSYKVSPHQMGDILDEFNSLKRLLGCLLNHGGSDIKDVKDAEYLIPHLAEVFGFRPQFDPEEGSNVPDISRDFVFKSDPRACEFDGDDDDNDDSETNGDLH